MKMPVIPAQAGISRQRFAKDRKIPACVGMKPKREGRQNLNRDFIPGQSQDSVLTTHSVTALWTPAQGRGDNWV